MPLTVCPRRAFGTVAYGVTMPDPQHPGPTRDDENRSDDASEGQVSEGPSGFSGTETAVGGADAVPDTPDTNPGTSEPIRESAADGS
jgi:hypothetical protein